MGWQFSDLHSLQINNVNSKTEHQLAYDGGQIIE